MHTESSEAPPVSPAPRRKTSTERVRKYQNSGKRLFIVVTCPEAARVIEARSRGATVKAVIEAALRAYGAGD